MSNLTALAVIMAILVAAQLSIFWCARRLQDRADGIATGVLRDVPVSTEYPGVLLFNQWMPMQFFLAISLGAQLFFYLTSVLRRAQTD